MRTVLLAALLLAALAQALAADPPVIVTGDKVFPKFDAVVKLGNVVIDDAKFYLPWEVQDVNGEWLWVGDDRKGWVQRNQVVSMAEASEYYTGLINNRRHEGWSRCLRARVYFKRGDLDSAISDLGELVRFLLELRVRPDCGNAKPFMLISIDRDLVTAYCDRGTVWCCKKDYEKAVADFDEAIRLAPSDAHLYDRRGRAWRLMNDFDKAIADYSDAIRLDPNCGAAYADRGDAWCRKKDFDKAIADLNEAIRLDSKNVILICDVAWLRATCTNDRCRSGKEAVELATKACELSGWLNANCCAALAAAYAECGDFDSAVKYENKAIDLNPNDADFVAGAKKRLTLYEVHKPHRHE